MRDGADLVVEGYDFAPTFSIWTTIEECLNPPLIWERERGFYTTAPFSEPEVFEFPEGIGPVRVRERRARGGRADPALGATASASRSSTGSAQEFIDVLRTLHKLGLDSTEPVSVRGAKVAPRDVVAAALPDPATLGERMTGRTCAGTWVTGTGKDGRAALDLPLPRGRQRARRCASTASQAVVWQTAINPVVALELLDRGRVAGRRRARPRGVPAEAVPRAARASSARRTAQMRAAAPGLTALPAREPSHGARASLPARRVPDVSASEVHRRRDRRRGRLLEQARRRGFGLAREELAEERPRDEHQHERRGPCRRCPSTAAA